MKRQGVRDEKAERWLGEYAERKEAGMFSDCRSMDDSLCRTPDDEGAWQD